MTEKAKMLAGELYNTSDSQLVVMRQTAKRLSHEYNSVASHISRKETILNQLFPNMGANCDIQAPIHVDYGCFTTLGERVFINYNVTILDCAPVKIGTDTMLGPNVSLLTPIHPLRYQERNVRADKDGQLFNYEYAKPITIGDNCWLAGNVTVIGGVTIGAGAVIGAGSVVTKDVPANSLAVGNPCRVIRKITAADAMTLPD